MHTGEEPEPCWFQENRASRFRKALEIQGRNRKSFDERHIQTDEDVFTQFHGRVQLDRAPKQRKSQRDPSIILETAAQ